MPVRLNGSTSGYVELKSPAVAGTTSVTMPAQSVDLSTLGRAWTSYTPVLSGTGWSIGNGTSVGAYSQIGKTVSFRGVIAFGTTSTFGTSGVLAASLPVASAASGGIDAALGSAIAYQPSTGVYFCGYRGDGSSKIVFHYPSNSAGLAAYFIGNSPFVWGSACAIYFSGTYEAA